MSVQAPMSPQRLDARRRLVTAARVHLSSADAIGPRFVDVLCRQVGMHPRSFNVLFESDEAFLDAVHDSFVADCATRLRGGVEGFTPSTPHLALGEAAVALAASWPLDRASLLIRAERRIRALRTGAGGAAVAAIFEQLAQRAGRRFTWSPVLAVWVILDTYERSFESWLLEDHAEGDFAASPYVQRTLPSLLAEMSAPLDREGHR
jgi:hypothetical protein